MIAYLGDLLHFLTPSTMPDRQSVEKNIDHYRNLIGIYTTHATKLNVSICCKAFP